MIVIFLEHLLYHQKIYKNSPVQKYRHRQSSVLTTSKQTLNVAFLQIILISQSNHAIKGYENQFSVVVSMIIFLIFK